MKTLSPPEIKFWQDILDERVAQLQSNLRRVQSDEEAAPDRQPGVDVEDEADIAQRRLQIGLRQAEANRDLAELRDIEAALRRLATGVFGFCVDCGVRIPNPRLQALPASARCVRCQEQCELDHPVQVRLPPGL